MHQNTLNINKKAHLPMGECGVFTFAAREAVSESKHCFLGKGGTLTSSVNEAMGRTLKSSKLNDKEVVYIRYKSEKKIIQQIQDFIRSNGTQLMSRFGTQLMSQISTKESCNHE